MDVHNMTNGAINRVIHEKLFDNCVHDFTNSRICSKCKERLEDIIYKNTYYYISDYSGDWREYGKVLEKIKYMEIDCNSVLFNPRKGCEYIIKYLISKD